MRRVQQRYGGDQHDPLQFLRPGDIVLHSEPLYGGTESLAEHPATMTHADVDPAERIAMGIGEEMVRLSIRVEHPEDLIADLEQALEVL